MQNKNTRKPLFITLIVFVLIAFTASTGYLIDSALYYRSEWFSTQNLVRAPFYSLVSDQTELTQTQPSRWVIFGDSRVFRLPPLSQFQIALPSNTSLINKGEGGITSARASEIFEKEILPLQPKVALFQVGINDVMTQESSQAVTSMKTFVNNFIESCRKNKIEPVLSTVIPVSELYLFKNIRWVTLKSGQFQKWNNVVSEINEWIRQESTSKGLRLVDFDKLLRDENQQVIKHMYDGDGVHLSSEGQKLILQKTVSAMTGDSKND